MSRNPLLESHELPPFADIRADHVVPAVETLLDESREAIDRLAQQAAATSPTWDNFAAPLEAVNDRLSQAWSPVSHLNGTMNTPELRDAYQPAWKNSLHLAPGSVSTKGCSKAGRR